MKGRTRTPLWLICDVSAAIRLALATWMLTRCIRAYWPRTRPPTRKGAASISLALCCAEALLRWAIMRQALRYCGRDPREARLFQLPLACNSFCWQARCAAFIRMAGDMTLYARRWARRMNTAPATSPVIPDGASDLLLSSTFFVFTPAVAAAPAGQRIRAPPWRLANTSNTPSRALPVHRRGRGRLCAGPIPYPRMDSSPASAPAGSARRADRTPRAVR